VVGAYKENERIDYDPETPLKTFLKLSKTIGLWKAKAGRLVKVQVLPEQAADEIAAGNGTASCKYRLYAYDGAPSEWYDARAVPEGNGTYYVEYVLHPSFPNPIRKVTDRGTSFKLQGRGWGEFLIHVRAVTKQGNVFRFDHWLRLEDRSPAIANESGASAAYKPTAFVSYSTADYPLFGELRRLLQSRGIEVVSDDQLTKGQPWELEVRALIGNADVLLALFSEEPSRWVLEEVNEAKKQQVPIIPVLLGEHAALPEEVAETAALRPKNSEEALKVIEIQLSKLNL
jgi:hypothetical protein